MSGAGFEVLRFEPRTDGNEVAPTIGPSINCHPCQRHFTINAGVSS